MQRENRGTAVEYSHQYWMQKVLLLAKQAAEKGEVPVGALIVREDEELGPVELGSGHNQPIGSHDPTAHAEIIALRRAAEAVQNYRLPNTTLYVSIEPCTMCLGAIMHARVKTLVFGAKEPRAGAVVSQPLLEKADYFNHKLEIVSDVCAEECAELMTRFFKSRR